MSAIERRVRQTAARAADKVEAGWCRGELRKVIRGRVHLCLIGAIQASTRSGIVESGVITRAAKVLGFYHGLVSWNDEKWRRKGQVVRLLRRVAAGEGT